MHASCAPRDGLRLERLLQPPHLLRVLSANLCALQCRELSVEVAFRDARVRCSCHIGCVYCLLIHLRALRSDQQMSALASAPYMCVLRVAGVSCAPREWLALAVAPASAACARCCFLRPAI